MIRESIPNSTIDCNEILFVLGCGCADGSIQLWDLRKSSIAPATQLRKAHLPSEISSIRFSHIGNYLLTRSLDSTMKLWDIRAMKTCTKEVGDLYTRYDTTDAIFSPNDKIAVTSHSLDKGMIILFHSHIG